MLSICYEKIIKFSSLSNKLHFKIHQSQKFVSVAISKTVRDTDLVNLWQNCAVCGVIIHRRKISKVSSFSGNMGKKNLETSFSVNADLFDDITVSLPLPLFLFHNLAILYLGSDISVSGYNHQLSFW